MGYPAVDWLEISVKKVYTAMNIGNKYTCRRWYHCGNFRRGLRLKSLATKLYVPKSHRHTLKISGELSKSWASLTGTSLKNGKLRHWGDISKANVEKTKGELTGGGAPEDAGPVADASNPRFEDILVLVVPVVDENSSVNTVSRVQTPSSATQTALPDISIPPLANFVSLAYHILTKKLLTFPLRIRHTTQT